MRGKLNAVDAAQIRAQTLCGCPGCGRKPSMEELALSYGVTAPTIHAIVHGKTWKGIAPAAPDTPLPPVPSEHLVRDVMRTVSQRYPHGGMQLSSAIKLTIALTVAGMPRAFPGAQA